MSFFKKFFRKKSDQDLIHELIPPTEEMVSEGDRTYRGFIKNYNQYIEKGILPKPNGYTPIKPSGKGLFKARLFSSQFIPVVIIFKYEKYTELFEQFSGIASGVAIKDIMNPENQPHFSREEAILIADDYMIDVAKAIIVDLKQGGTTQINVMEGTESDAFNTLVNIFHDNLKESIGVENYTSEVIDNFDQAVKMNVANSISYTLKWARSV